MVDMQQIGAFCGRLEVDDWTCGSIDEKAVKLSKRKLGIILHIYGEDNFLHLRSLLYFRPVPEARLGFFHYLHFLNNHLRLARFVLDHREEVVLRLDHFTRNCNFSEFRQLLQGIESYHIHYSREIKLIAQNPQLANLWVRLGLPETVPISVTRKNVFENQKEQLSWQTEE